VLHRILYCCSHMATVGVKGLMVSIASNWCVAWPGRSSSRCSSGRRTPRLATNVDWYGCDTFDQSRQHPSLTRPHSVAADCRMSPACDELCGTTSRLHTNTPVDGHQSSVRARHEQQRRHYLENGVDEPKYDNNDLLQRHRSWFRKERPFTPRTLHSTQVSRLSSMSSCYCNPRLSRSQTDSQVDPADDADLEQEDPCGAGGAMSDTITYDTIRSRPGYDRQTPDEVPPLRISLDMDQAKYLKHRQSRQRESETVRETDGTREPADTTRMDRTSLMAAKHQLWVAHLLSLVTITQFYLSWATLSHNFVAQQRCLSDIAICWTFDQSSN